MGALLGACVTAFLTAVVCAPAAWLADRLAQATDGRFLLADARGSVWDGSAVLVLTGGPGSRSASALPGRLHWTIGLDGSALGLRARQDCCINGELRLRITPALSRARVDLVVPGSAPATAAGVAVGEAIGRTLGRTIGQWPASWLVGLGAPWNTLQPTGTLQLSSRGLSLEQVQGRWRFNGTAELELGNIASRLAALDVLGSYRLSLQGDAAQGQPPRLQLRTTSGALLLDGQGEWSGPDATARLRFSGTAAAAPGAEAALGGLLNIIGRRQGARSLITIG
jgi:general secretion pathway protein N